MRNHCNPLISVLSIWRLRGAIHLLHASAKACLPLCWGHCFWPFREQSFLNLFPWPNSHGECSNTSPGCTVAPLSFRGGLLQEYPSLTGDVSHSCLLTEAFVSLMLGIMPRVTCPSTGPSSSAELSVRSVGSPEKGSFPYKRHGKCNTSS